MVPHEEGFVVFGGLFTSSSTSTDYTMTSVIAKYDPGLNTWSKLGDLNHRRHAFGLIEFGHEYLIVGGWGDKKTETCQLQNGEMTCSEREPTMKAFR